jgi:hypothetical protein
MRYRLLRWSTHDDQPAPAKDLTYHPEFRTIVQATDFLASLNTKTPQTWRVIRFPASFIASSLRCTLALLTHRPRPRVFLAVAGHMKALAHSRAHCWPEIWRRTLTSPGYKTLSSTDIALASRIHLTLHPIPPPPRWLSFAWGYTTFSTCSLLVIGTELTINWNGITGVQKLNTVGQLIPLSLGVGGLVQVVWSALFDKDAGEKLCFGKCHTTRRRQDWAEASELYRRAGEAWERRRRGEGLGKEAMAA